MKKEGRGKDKWNMLVVQGILVVFAIPVLYRYSEIRKRRKKEKGEYVGCAGLLLVVDAILVLYYNSN